MFLKTYKVAVLIALFCGIVPGGSSAGYAAENPASPRIILSSGSEDTFVQQIKTVEDGGFVLDKNASFKMEARIEPVLTTEKTVYSKHDLALSPPAWECRDFPCTRTWSIDLSKQSLSTDDFPHLLLSWDQAVPGETPEVTVALSANAKTTDEKDRIAHFEGHFKEGSNRLISPISTMEMKDAVYKKKSWLYVLKRDFGFKSDNEWRYCEDANNLILQSRIDVPASKVQVFQIVTDAKTSPRYVNFSIDSHGTGKRDRFISFQQIRHSTETIGDTTVLTIDVAESLKALGLNPDKVVIMEPIIALPTVFSAYEKDKPFKKLIFAAENQIGHTRIVMPQIQKNNNHVSLDFDFSQTLEQSRLWDARWQNITITVRSSKPQQIQWTDATFLDYWQGRVPALASAPVQALSGWGFPVSAIGTEQVRKFRPIYYNHQTQGTPISPLRQMTHTPFQDRDMGVTGDHLWYQIKKEPRAITLKGIFTDRKGLAHLTIQPFSKSVHIAFTGSKAASVIVEQLNGSRIDLPLRFFLVDGKLPVPANAALSLRIVPEKPPVSSVPVLQTGRNKIPEAEAFNESWDLRLEATEWDQFTDAVFPAAQAPPVQRNWFAADGHVKNDLWIWRSGPLPVWGNLMLTTPTGKMNLPMGFSSNWANPKVPDNASIEGFIPLKESWLPPLPPSDTETICFDVQTAQPDSPLNLQDLIWWEKTGEIPLNSTGPNMVTDAETQKIYLFRNHTKPMQWTFTLPATPYMLPRQLTLPVPLPPFCKLELKIGDQTWSPPANTPVWDIPEKIGAFKTLTLTLTSWGEEPVLVVSRPALRVVGIQRTADSDMALITVNLDGKKIPMNPSEFRDSSSEWVRLPDIALTAGKHKIGLVNSRYFRIDRLKLHTDSPQPWPDESSNTPPAPSLWYRLFWLGIKLMFLAGIGYATYIFRHPLRITFNRFWQPFRRITSDIYDRFSDRTWSIAWLAISGILYITGVLMPVQGSENYFITFGGMTVVCFLWHVSRWQQERITRQFPRIAASVYDSRSKTFFAWALILLVVTAILLTMKLEIVAEQAAVIVYYLLVIGTVGEVVALRRGSDKNGAENA